MKVQSRQRENPGVSQQKEVKGNRRMFAENKDDKERHILMMCMVIMHCLGRENECIILKSPAL